MTGFSDLANPYTGLELTNTINGNNAIANSMKAVLISQNDTSQFLATAVGTTVNINYGTATTLETAYLTYDGVTITFVTPGLYFAAIKLQVGRTSASGTANIATRTVFTPSGGSAENSAPRYTEFPNTDSSGGLTRSGLLNVAAGDAFKGEFVKDSGSVTVELEAVTLTTTGWGTSPSASIEMYKLNENGTNGLIGF